MAKICAFCQREGQKITKEHAWPNWVRRLFTAERHNVILAMADRPLRQWSPSPDSMGVTVQDFCEGCNNGWMSDLEHDIAPLLGPLIDSNAARVVSASEQQRLATWCYKTVTVFDLVTAHEEGPYFTASDRLAFFTTRRPPENAMMIWAGAYAGSNVGTCVDYRFFYDNIRNPGTPGQGYVSTISVGRFVFQLLTVRGNEEFRRLKLPPNGWDDATVGLEPNGGEDMRWPPRNRMTDAGLSAFIDRFRPKTEASIAKDKT
jgi:hypothetical protein